MKTQLTLIAVLCAPLVARADDPPDPEMQGPPTKSPVREGATVTLSVGPAEIHLLPDGDADETRIEGAGFSLRVGWNLSQSAAFEGIIDFIDDGKSTRNSVLGGSVKFYSGDALYFRLGGGLGIASRAGESDPMDPSSGGGTDRHFGAAAIAAAGYEWFQLRDIALFGEFEMMGIRLIGDPDPKTTLINASLLFGITWY